MGRTARCLLFVHPRSSCHLPPRTRTIRGRVPGEILSAGFEKVSFLPPKFSAWIVDLTGSRLPKSRRNQHILASVRQGMASRLMQPQNNIHYCHECFDWVVGDEWEDHCQAHLSAMTSKWCERIAFRHHRYVGFLSFINRTDLFPEHDRKASMKEVSSNLKKCQLHNRY